VLKAVPQSPAPQVRSRIVRSEHDEIAHCAAPELDRFPAAVHCASRHLVHGDHSTGS
jgi:hypothetical protein